MESLHEAETWVAVGFVLFVGLLLYLGAPRMIARFLDERTARIVRELEEAKKLREEAQELLAQASQKCLDAGSEAEAIVRQAKSDAEAFAQETRRRFTETMERRSASAEQKIAQAEAQAVAEMRALAADRAIAAAETLLATRLDDKRAADLVKRSLEEIPTKLN